MPTRAAASMDAWFTTVAYTIGIGVGVPIVASIVTPLALGTLTLVRQRLFTKEPANDDKEALRSALLTGRVWHSRFHPTKHSFSYPLFMFGVDLDEEESFNRKLWPLSCIMNFSTKHHLINGEGGGEGPHRLLRERIYALVQERTSGYLHPTQESHRVWLVTHLSYYGYCFNPVSFYYLLNRSTGRMQAIVAEVSNTPWIEMHSYVLHPTSSDRVKYSRNQDGATNFKFPKTFHVSPFMEMNYTYDWVFAGEEEVSNGETMRVTTAMTREDGTTHFSATMKLRQTRPDPLVLAWQLARYPSYCLIIQIWIHYEAFWLFWKGVAYQPHPDDAETTASRIIGAVMTPVFELQALLSKTDTKEGK